MPVVLQRNSSTFYLRDCPTMSNAKWFDNQVAIPNSRENLQNTSHICNHRYINTTWSVSINTRLESEKLNSLANIEPLRNDNFWIFWYSLIWSNWNAKYAKKKLEDKKFQVELAFVHFQQLIVKSICQIKTLQNNLNKF